MLRRFAIAMAAFVCLVGCEKQGTEPAAPAGSPATQATNTNEPGVCLNKTPTDKPLLRIVVIPKGTTHEFWKAIHAGAVKAEIELPGVHIEWNGPTKEDDREQQINVVDTSINAGFDGIVLAPLDNAALVRPVREARKAGIGVVIMDSGLQAEPCLDYASYVATDNYVGGQKAAERLGELLNHKGKILVLRYQVGSASTEQREQGFLDTISKPPFAFEILSSDQYGGATTESAYAKAENLLNRFAEVDGIFCPNESTTFGMLRALQESGRAGKIKFVGFDSSPKLIQAMADGQLHGLVLQDPLNMGYTAVKTMVAYLRGEPVVTRIDTGSRVATPENMLDPQIEDLLSPPIDRYLK